MCEREKKKTTRGGERNRNVKRRVGHGLEVVEGERRGHGARQRNTDSGIRRAAAAWPLYPLHKREVHG